MTLTIGKDKDLLNTRAEVLRRADSYVVAALFEDAENILRNEEFDVVVVCHTLNDSEFAWVASIIQNTQGRNKILRIRGLGKPKGLYRVVSNTLEVAFDPERLVDTVRNSLPTKN